ncbi:MAG: hypothetical protein U9R66_12745 [Thermodesulfobacteriota bacterium]|nr:hypothetical protein [Thermodesulfobacteriota bacterium]
MIAECPHCQHPLKLTENQLAKIEKALAGLQPGKFLKLGCPNCKKAIELDRDGSTAVGKKQPPGDSAGLQAKKEQEPKGPPVPPAEPDIDWLKSGELEEKEMLGDVTQVLILMAASELRDQIVSAFENRGYKPVYPESAADAIKRMRFVHFAAVVLHVNFEGNLASSVFHQHMRALLMTQRRSIYYVLIGPDFHTLYDLEALSNSVNLVVNESEIDRFDLILRKGLQDHDDLFGLYIKMLKEHGR